tara:strand:- start:1821 stop:2030 length:210 start_codon:yes stop_codon:yes gene_type:complete
MGTKQKVFSIKEKLHKLEKQLEEIQKNCTHQDKSIKFLSLNDGTRWVCNDCQQVLNVATSEEVQKWINK